eukprot:TRINITY_DN4517_c0_g1_i1.p1 TRINITY_DN4517_c0_g1~~TRINITY_DN4517_c0_g1_i1.p1  ORF type:complete len:438 (-),score=85.92 TRINITY_DN4517_c0_g1_i1:121-1257(-)
MNHQNLSRFLGVCRLPRGLFVVTEETTGLILADVLAPKGSRRGGANWELFLRVCLGMAKGMSYLHQKKITFHMFSAASVMTDTQGHTKLVTPALMRCSAEGRSIRATPEGIQKNIIALGRVLSAIAVGGQTSGLELFDEGGTRLNSTVLREGAVAKCPLGLFKSITYCFPEEPIPLSAKELLSILSEANTADTLQDLAHQPQVADLMYATDGGFQEFRESDVVAPVESALTSPRVVHTGNYRPGQSILLTSPSSGSGSSRHRKKGVVWADQVPEDYRPLTASSTDPPVAAAASAASPQVPRPLTRRGSGTFYGLFSSKGKEGMSEKDEPESGPTSPITPAASLDKPLPAPAAPEEEEAPSRRSTSKRGVFAFFFKKDP